MNFKKDFDCSMDMNTKHHHDEAALRAGSFSGSDITHAILALDDTLARLVVLQERQTLALERLAAAIEGKAAIEGQGSTRPAQPLLRALGGSA